MALAEARAIWQRTANRCLVQEDAKRAPKIACCPPLCPAVKPAYFRSVTAAGGHDIPKTAPTFFNLNPSHFNPFPTSKWWLQFPPNYGQPEVVMDDQLNTLGSDSDTCPMHECLANPEEGLRIEGIVGCEIPKKGKEFSGSSWIEANENIPWWRTADADELSLLVAHLSLDCIENCDLPIPQNLRVKKDVNANVCCFCHGGTSCSLHGPNLGYVHYKLGRETAGNASQKHHMTNQGWSMSNTEKPPRDTPGPECNLEMHTSKPDTGKAQLLKAICHSQTRAREAEAASRQTHAEIEHVIKLVLRQASQLFAYKLWLQLLQMENLHLQFKDHKDDSVSPSVPWTKRRPTKRRKSQHLSSNDKQPRQYYYPPSNVSKNAVVLAVGLGLVGAGFLLGWTAAWMLPSW